MKSFHAAKTAVPKSLGSHRQKRSEKQEGYFTCSSIGKIFNLENLKCYTCHLIEKKKRCVLKNIT